MTSTLDNLSKVDRNTTFQVLSKISNSRIEIHIKGKDELKINKTALFKNTARKQFYIENRNLFFEPNAEVTFKIIVDQRLFFLKTAVKRSATQYYFDNYDNMYELVRRKKPRFQIPEHWAQVAKIQSLHAPSDLKSPANILDISRAGLRLVVRAELPRYEINQVVNVYFKIYRRAEILAKCKIIYFNHNNDSGPTLGLEFVENTILINNKIQNVCDDLAFFYTSESELR